MSNFRVVVSDATGMGDCLFRIEDVVQHPRWSGAPFVRHEDGLLAAQSVNDLKRLLLDMAKACDKPVMYFHSELREWK